MAQMNLRDARHRYDNVHIRKSSVRLLAQNIKRIVNPLLGLKDYYTYEVYSQHNSTDTTNYQYSSRSQQAEHGRRDRLHNLQYNRDYYPEPEGARHQYDEQAEHGRRDKLNNFKYNSDRRDYYPEPKEARHQNYEQAEHGRRDKLHDLKYNGDRRDYYPEPERVRHQNDDARQMFTTFLDLVSTFNKPQ